MKLSEEASKMAKRMWQTLDRDQRRERQRKAAIKGWATKRKQKKQNPAK